jgi:hypothetical protein
VRRIEAVHAALVSLATTTAECAYFDTFAGIAYFVIAVDEVDRGNEAAVEPRTEKTEGAARTTEFMAMLVR